MNFRKFFPWVMNPVKESEASEGTFNARNEMEKIIRGEANDREVARVAGMIRDFQKTDVFILIKTYNENWIKGCLTGKTIGDSERHLGRMEGILAGFEQAVTLLGTMDREETVITGEEN